MKEENTSGESPDLRDVVARAATDSPKVDMRKLRSAEQKVAKISDARKKLEARLEQIRQEENEAKKRAIAENRKQDAREKIVLGALLIASVPEAQQLEIFKKAVELCRKHDKPLIENKILELEKKMEK
jgi:hypothetical protein